MQSVTVPAWPAPVTSVTRLTLSAPESVTPTLHGGDTEARSLLPGGEDRDCP